LKIGIKDMLMPTVFIMIVLLYMVVRDLIMKEKGKVNG